MRHMTVLTQFWRKLDINVLLLKPLHLIKWKVLFILSIRLKLCAMVVKNANWFDKINEQCNKNQIVCDGVNIPYQGQILLLKERNVFPHDQYMMKLALKSET